MINKVLAISDVDVTDTPVIYTCYGLGSCIGLFLTDRMKPISGGAHIPLPSKITGSEMKDALSLIDSMLFVFREKGSDLSCIRAKLAGGSLLYENSPDIGQQNSSSVLSYLVRNRIFIAAMDIGGRHPRTVNFNSATGALAISTGNQSRFCI